MLFPQRHNLSPKRRTFSCDYSLNIPSLMQDGEDNDPVRQTIVDDKMAPGRSHQKRIRPMLPQLAKLWSLGNACEHRIKIGQVLFSMCFAPLLP